MISVIMLYACVARSCCMLVLHVRVAHLFFTFVLHVCVARFYCTLMSNNFVAHIYRTFVLHISFSHFCRTFFSHVCFFTFMSHVTFGTMVTMGGDLQSGCLADRLLTGLGQPQINP